MDLSKCLKVVGAFSPEEIQELEDRAASVSAGGAAQAHHYLVAAEQIFSEAQAELNGSSAAAAPAAPPPAAPAVTPTAQPAPGSPQGRVYRKGKLVDPTAPPPPEGTRIERDDMRDIDNALARYNSTADEAKALEALQWIADEAADNKSPRVRAHAERILRDEASPADLAKLTRSGPVASVAQSTDGERLSFIGRPATRQEFIDGPLGAMAENTDAWNATPQDLGYRNAVVNTENGEFGVSRLSGLQKQALAAAGANLEASPAAPFLSAAMKTVRGYMTGYQPTDNDGKDVVGMFFKTTGMLWLSRTRLLDPATWGDTEQGSTLLTTTLAHELVHTVDLNGYGPASTRLDSPTFVTVRNVNGAFQPVASPMMEQLLVTHWKYFKAGMKTRYERALGYAMHDAFAYMGQMVDEPVGTFDSEYMQEAKRAYRHAAVETPAVLMEMYLLAPERLKQDAPLAYEYISQLGQAGTIDEAQAILGGTNGSGDESSGQGPRVVARGIPEALRSFAADVEVAESRAVSGPAQAVPGRGQAAGSGGGDGRDGGGRLDESDLPPSQPRSKAGLMAREVAGGWKNFPSALGWLTTRQLAERFKSMPAMRRLSERINQMQAMAKNRLQEAHLIDQEWAGLPDDAAMELQRLMLEATLERMHIDRASNHESNRHLDMTDGRVTRKWIELSRRYAELQRAHPKAAEVYHQVEEKFRKDWNERGQLLKDRIVDMYRAELTPVLGDQLAEVAKLPAAKREEFIRDRQLSRNASRALRAMWSDMDAHGQELGRVKGPYFPLVRFGRHVVVAKSPRFLRAQTEYQDAQAVLDRLNDSPDATVEELTKAREDLAARREEVSNLKNDPRDYVVEFYEKRTEAGDREAQLRSWYQSRGRDGMEVYSELRDQHITRLDQVSPAFMNRLEETLRAGLPDKDAATIRAAVRDLYIQSMPERSALKAQLARLNVRGAKASEMRRAFAAASMRNAWHISRLAHNLPMHEALTELRNGKGDEAKLVGNEMALRFAKAMSFDEPNMALSVMANLGYFTYLGLSPSFLMMNLAQPWIVSVPVMAGRFGIGAPTRELGRAWMETGKALTSSFKDADKSWQFELDLDKFRDPGERQMLGELFDNGIIDITIEHDLGAVAAGDLQTVFGKVMKFSALPAHHTEVLNRVSTALTAYRLDKADSARRGITGADAERKAVMYADRVVAETHMDYTPENAPRLMRSESLGGFGRLVFQFKKYSQGMLYLLSKNMLDAARGDPESLKAVGYLMGMTFGVAGMTGMPFAVPASLLSAVISKMWPDDDEPEFGVMVYNGLKSASNEAFARAVFKGLPAAMGVDVAERIGLGNLLDPFGLSRDSTKEPFTRDWTAEKVFQIMGPAAAMGANWFEAMSAAADGDVSGAAKKALPKFLADGVRAAQMSTDGVRSMSGDTLISADELGVFATATQALGFRPTDVSDMYENRAALARSREGRDDARSRIIQEYVQARLAGKSTADAREAMQDYNSRQPSARITYAQLEQAVVRQRREDRSMKNGVRAEKRDADLIRRLGL